MGYCAIVSAETKPGRTYRSVVHRAGNRGKRQWAELAQCALLCLEHGELEAAQSTLRKLMRLCETDSPSGSIAGKAHKHGPPVAASPLSIFALGDFAIAVNGTRVEPTFKPQRKPLDLLKALIVCGGKPVAASKMADTLWPEAEGDAARNCLRVTIHRLRHLIACKDALLFRDEKLWLDPHLWCVDAWVFDQQSDRLSDVSAHASTPLRNLMETVAIYRGHLFANEGEPWWILDARERLRRKWLGLVLRLGRCYEARHRWPEACETYSRALTIDPLAEPLYRQLMLCQQQSAQRAEMLNTYRLCRHQLQAGLGAAPSEQTESLYQSLN